MTSSTYDGRALFESLDDDRVGEAGFGFSRFGCLGVGFDGAIFVLMSASPLSSSLFLVMFKNLWFSYSVVIIRWRFCIFSRPSNLSAPPDANNFVYLALVLDTV